MSLPVPPELPDDVQALIFDCDGTLADTFSAHYRTFCTALAPYKVEFTAAFYAARVGMSRRQLLEALQNETGIAIDDADIAVRTPPIFLENIYAVTAIPVTEGLARRHHGRLKMAVASAGQKSVVRASLKAIGLIGLFDTIVTIEDTGKAKPEPDLFLKAAANMSMSPDAVMVFEDSDEGIEAARRAGMRCIDIRPYYQSDPARW